jgi:hypothetical protein
MSQKGVEFTIIFYVHIPFLCQGDKESDKQSQHLFSEKEMQSK